MPRPAIVHAILARLRNLSLPQALQTLLGLMLVRGALQARITIGLVEELRQRLLSHVLHAPSLNLQQLGRDLIGLLMADISSSVLALEQVTRALQASSALGCSMQACWRWGGGQLGRLRTRLNGALQRTVGDGLHGVKAVPAAGGET